MYTNQYCGRFVVSCPELIHYSESRPRFSNNIIESNRSKPPRRLTASIRCSQMILFLLESFTLPAIHTPSPYTTRRKLWQRGGVNVLVPHRRPRTLKAGKCALGVWDVHICICKYENRSKDVYSSDVAVSVQEGRHGIRSL